MDRSHMQISFHVDPTDGLCTLLGPDFDLSEVAEAEIAFCVETVEDAGSDDYEVMETTESLQALPEHSGSSPGSVECMDNSSDDRDSNLSILQPSESDQQDVLFFRNPADLCDDLRYILNKPEMCDVTFLVGKTRTPVYAVKAILATRSQFFLNLIMSHQNSADEEKKPALRQKKGFFRRLFRKRFGRKYKKLSSRSFGGHARNLEINIDDFDVDIFQRVIIYLHSGKVNVTIQSAIGLMSAADAYGLLDLTAACTHFARGFIQVNTVLTLLVYSQPYSQYRSTQALIDEILDFVSLRAEEVLSLSDFEFLPKSTAATILLREDLQAQETTKWTAALRWTHRHCQKKGKGYFRRTLKLFIRRINFQELCPQVLEKEVQPLGLVSDDVIGEVLANQTRNRHVIGQDGSRVPPPKPPRRRRVSQNLRRASVSAAAILAPIRGWLG